MALAAQISVVHKALGDETRLRMLSLLSGLGELCVCDLEAALDITQSKASRHLRVLREAGLVTDRRDGTWVYYALRTDLSRTANDALVSLVSTYGRSADGKRDLSRARRMRQSCG